MAQENEIAKLLLEKEAVKLNYKEPFTFVSGIISPIYCDNRIIMSYPDARTKVIDAFLATIKKNNLEFDIVAGVATAGIPLAALIAERLNKPLVYIRAKKKEHGRENLIEGIVHDGQKALVIEDHFSTGGSSVEAIQNIRDAGAVVDCCLSISTYEFDKCIERFSEANCEMISLTTFTTIIETAKEEKLITDDEAQKIVEWNKNPQEWAKNMGLVQ